MNVYLNFYSGLAIVMLAIFSCIFRWKQTDLPGRLFFAGLIWYLFTDFVLQGGLLYKDYFIKYKTFYYLVRNIEAPVSFILYTLFFHFAVEQFRRKRIALYLVPAGIVLWVACAIIFRNEENINTYYVPLTSVSNIMLAIIAINEMQKKCEFKDLLKQPVFCFIALDLFFYGFSFFFYVSYPLILKDKQTELFAVYFMLRLIDVYNIGSAATYFLYPKKRNSNWMSPA